MRMPGGSEKTNSHRFLSQVFHHIPGLVAAPSLIMAGYHHNENLQRIGWSLLLAGGVSLFTEGLKQTRSMSTQLGQWLTLHLISLAGVLFARFYIFPYAAMGLLDDITAVSPELYNLAALGIGSMAFFNVAVGAILSEKLIKYGWIFVRGRRVGAEASMMRDVAVKEE
jgi:hypothetical protein